jgi:hypothetical protein
VKMAGDSYQSKNENTDRDREGDHQGKGDGRLLDVGHYNGDQQNHQADKKKNQSRPPFAVRNRVNKEPTAGWTSAIHGYDLDVFRRPPFEWTVTFLELRAHATTRIADLNIAHPMVLSCKAVVPSRAANPTFCRANHLSFFFEECHEAASE